MVKRFRRRKQVKSEAPTRVVRLLPNMVTVAALCTGLSAVRFAFMGRWDFAVAAIVVASILDVMDGRLARLLDSATDFGAELDSLSDFVSFGVAPALITYLFILQEGGDAGWSVVLFFTACTAFRLARFNVHRSASSPGTAQRASFFTGVPAPAGALVALLPFMFMFSAGACLPAYVFAIFMGGSALLMVSRVPTFSSKNVHLSHGLMAPALMGVAFLGACFFSFPWVTLCVLGLCYLGAIPLSIKAARTHQPSRPPSQPSSTTTLSD